jgi:hypothetical protein
MGCMHSINLVFLLTETELNTLVSSVRTRSRLVLSYKIKTTLVFGVMQKPRGYYCAVLFQAFPWFRVAYFSLLTRLYVTVQWIAHACGLTW